MDEAGQELEVVRRYLLGRLDEEEQKRCELRVLTDAAFREEVSMIEGELIDDYVTGALNEEDRQSFAARYPANPRQASKLWLPTALHKRAVEAVPAAAPEPESSPADARPLPRRGWLETLRAYLTPRYALGAAALSALALLGTWALVRNRPFYRPADELAERADDEERSADERELARLQRGPGSTPEESQSRGTVSRTLLVTLNPGRSDTTKVWISPETEAVRFNLIVRKAGVKGGQAVFKFAGGGELFASDTQPTDEAGSKGVFVSVPARFLTDGDYQIILNDPAGARELHRYRFAVARRGP